MKRISLLLALLLLCSYSHSVSAQTKKTTKKRATTSQTPVGDATRARRTNPATAPPTDTQAPTAEKPKTEAEKVQTQAPKPREETPATPQEAPKATEQSEPEANTPADPVADLKSKIDTAESGVERIRLQLKLVDELLTQGNKTEALALLHTLAATDAFDPQSFYNTGNGLARFGDNDGAIEAYRKAIDQRKGGYSRALNNLGVVLLRLGRWDESHEALSSALKLENFRYPEASYNLGRLYAARGQTDLAIREWKRVLALEPKHAGAADALAHVGSDDAVVVEPARISGPTKAAPTVKASLGNSSSPSTQPTKAVALDATSYNFLQQARSLNEKGNATAAIENYQRLLGRQNGYFPVANLELSFALLSLKRYDEALNNLQLVANRDGSRYPISYFHLARVYETKGELKQAENWFSRAVAAFGNKNNQFLLDVSRVREKQGDYSGALQAMQQYVSLMQQQGLEPSWSDERLTALKQKVAAKQ